MGLLELLGLEARLPADLATGIDKIVAAGRTLGLPAAHQHAITTIATTAAQHFAALESRVEPWLYRIKRAQFAALAGRLGQRAMDDPAAAVDLAEVTMLAAEAAAAREDSDTQQAVLAEARRSYADILLGYLDSDGDLTADLQAYADGLIAGGADAPLGPFMGALETWRRQGGTRQQGAAAWLTSRLARDNQRRQKALGPSTAEREAPRMPQDVLVHLMTRVRRSSRASPDHPDLQQLAREGRRMFMAHQCRPGDVAALVERGRQVMAGLGDTAGAALCERLQGQLPALQAAGAAPATHRTLQHENLYGRVFDSLLVHALIKAPPQALLDASGLCAGMFASALEDSAPDLQAAANLRRDHILKDVRPWAWQVPDFVQIAAARTDSEALQAIRSFLGRKPDSGPEIVGQTYLMAKMAIHQQSVGNAFDYMYSAGRTYQVIRAQSLRERASPEAVISEGAGITMLHQPPAIDTPSLVPSERPATVQRPGERHDPVGLRDRDPAQALLTETMQMQFDHALPFSAGLSGTAGILLHMYGALRDIGLTGVGAPEFLMNTMLFFVHDGGHSMHEVLWVANLLDRQLALGLDIGDPARPNEFVADFDRFASGFTGDMKTAVENAMDQAWDGTQQYLEKNSFFAQ